MSELFAARSQMATSLGFHIVFAAIGMAMPLLMLIAQWSYLRGGNEIDRDLARRWSRGVAIVFAVGAVSGTVLSFELGLLWPEFMRHAGPVMSMPFSMEGFAFFMEAIFLGIYLYGWNRVPPGVHLASGAMVLVSGVLSGVFVVAANGWMNTPTGFRVEDGQFVDIDPLAAMLNPMWIPQAVHMTVSAFLAVGFGVAGVHAGILLRRPDSAFHRRALVIALWVGGVAAIAMPLSGDLLAKRVAVTQPIKLAAMEGHFHTRAAAPLHIGGIPDPVARRTDWSLEVPGGLSVLAYGSPDAVVPGLADFPEDEWPPILPVHLAFQFMVGVGSLLVAVTVLAAVLARRRPLWERPWFLRGLVLCAPLGFLGIEAGWIVTEVGRQPWIIHGVMRTSDAVTPMPHLVVPFAILTALYVLLALIVTYLLARHVFQSPEASP